MKSLSWLDALRRALDAGVPAALVTVACAEGSTPREAGACMLVTADGVHGTVGGGNLEFKSIELARARLADTGVVAPGGAAFHRFPLGPALGQCCGGAASIVIERIDAAVAGWVGELQARLAVGQPVVLATWLAGEARATRATGAVRPRLIERGEAACADEVAARSGLSRAVRDAARALYESGDAACLLADEGVLLARIAPEGAPLMLFGAGHVGQALARVLAGLPFRITWVDSRAGQFPAWAGGELELRESAAPEAEVDHAPAGAWYLVMTHSHALDQLIVERVLRRDDFAYLGLIGSRTKRALFERRLAERGIPPERFARLICPIGLPSIRGKAPGVIAVAVAAQLLELAERESAPAAMESR